MSVKFSDIIKQFSGEGDFFEWVQKLELVAKLQKVTQLENFLPLFLVGGAFAVYQSLSDETKADYKLLKQALLDAFSPDALTAFEELKNRFLHNESVDVYLADIRRLCRIVDSDVSDKFIRVSFLAGLPDQVKKQIRASTASDELSLSECVEIARKLVTVNTHCLASVSERSRNKIVCFECGEENHTKRTCPQLNKIKCTVCNTVGHSAQSCRRRACFVCGSFSHLANACPDRQKPKNA